MSVEKELKRQTKMMAEKRVAYMAAYNEMTRDD